jgi:hypothetical protein
VTADKLAETVTNAEHVTYQAITTTAVPWKFCVFTRIFGTTRPWFRIRVDDGGNSNAVQADYNVSTGAMGNGPTLVGTYASASCRIVGFPSGWFYVELIVTPSAVATTRVIFYTMDQDYATSSFAGNTAHVGDTAAGLYLWNAQANPV